MRTIIKTAPNRDLYLVWSSVVDAPIWVGSRAELIDYLALHQTSVWDAERGLQDIEEADRFGSTAHRYGFGFGFDDGPALVLTFDGLPAWGGTLARENFEAFAEALLANDTQKAVSLIDATKPADWEAP